MHKCVSECVRVITCMRVYIYMSVLCICMYMSVCMFVLKCNGSNVLIDNNSVSKALLL